MKFGKELTSQMVPEWQEAYVDYEYLKTILKDIHHFKHRNIPPPPHGLATNNQPGLNRRLTLYRAFSGLIQRTSSINSPRSSASSQDVESQPILVNSVKRSDGEEGYETRFLMAADEGGEYELVFFRRLDDEFNKVVKFYKSKVEEVMKEAAVLNTQMEALIAFRNKVDNPQNDCLDTSIEMSRLASDIEASAAAATTSGIRASRRVAHMDVIEEDRSNNGTRADESSCDGDDDDKDDKEEKPLTQTSVQELRIRAVNNTRETKRPAPLDILNRVTISKPIETPRSTIKGFLNVPVQTELQFSKENLDKIEEQLKRAFIEFYNKLRLLKSYSFLNLMAFSKILKKYDKITSRNASRSYLKMIDNSYLGSSDEVNKVMERVEATFIKHFSNSSRKEGLNMLRPIVKRQRHRVTAFVGFFAGCTVSLIVALILIIRARDLLEKKEEGREKYMVTMFPLYSLFAFIVLHMLMYAGNIYFWRRYRVNYSFIFGFKPGTALGYREVLLLSFGVAVLALGSVLANLDMEMETETETESYGPFTELLPLFIVVLVIVIMICPFNIIYRSSRIFFLTCLFHSICAPLYKVVLPDFILADQLTSQVQAFRSVEFYLCYYFSGNYKHRESTCGDNDVFKTFSFIVAGIPYWWRFLQCLRRFFEEKDNMQGLNGLKYLATIVAVCTRIAFTRNKHSIAWKVVAGIASTIAAVVSTYWDIVLDWGLLQRNSTNPWLRDKLLVPHTNVYFGAMGLNVLLRLAWLQTILDIKFSFLHRESMITLVASLEIIRRGIWNFFRLENEHLNNVGKYRAFKSVPLPFNYEDDKLGSKALFFFLALLSFSAFSAFAENEEVEFEVEASDPGLVMNFYKDSCPQAEDIIKEQVKLLYKRHKNTAFSWLRNIFHDCAVQSCDASLLLDSTRRTLSEKETDRSFGLRNFRYLDTIKEAVERECPGVVSCADILVLSGRDGIVSLGGPYIPLKTGRRDGRKSRADILEEYLPDHNESMTVVLERFASMGIDTPGIVALLGSHSVGRTHCVKLVHRLYPDVDPVLNPRHVEHMLHKCPDQIPDPKAVQYVRNDRGTPMVLDNNYYRNILDNKGLLIVDHQLATDKRTKPYVKKMAKSQDYFFKEFSRAITILTENNPLTGTKGEIRKQCNVANKHH